MSDLLAVRALLRAVLSLDDNTLRGLIDSQNATGPPAPSAPPRDLEHHRWESSETFKAMNRESMSISIGSLFDSPACSTEFDPKTDNPEADSSDLKTDNSKAGSTELDQKTDNSKAGSSER